MLDALFEPCIQQLNMQAIHNARGGQKRVCYDCVPEIGQGRFCALEYRGHFVISSLQLTLCESMCFNGICPDFCSIGLVSSTLLPLAQSKTKVPQNTIIRYAQSAGVFKETLKKDVVHQSRCITFSQTYIEELSDRFDSDLSRVFMPSKFSPIALEAVSLLSRILSLVQTADASAMYMEGMVQQLLSLLINDYTANTDSKRDCSISESDRCGVQNVASYLLEQYAQPIAVKTLEQVAFMGKTKLSCLFRQQYGMTLFSFLQKVRMEKAEELLVQTDLSIGEIMRQVGYSNLSGFTECFKRTTGYAPTQYRRQPE